MQLSLQFAGKPFQAPKIILKYFKLIRKKLLSYGYLLKEKGLKFTLLTVQTSQVVLRGISPPKRLKFPKTGILLNLRVWFAQKPKI